MRVQIYKPAEYNNKFQILNCPIPQCEWKLCYCLHYFFSFTTSSFIFTHICIGLVYSSYQIPRRIWRINLYAILRELKTLVYTYKCISHNLASATYAAVAIPSSCVVFLPLADIRIGHKIYFHTSFLFSHCENCVENLIREIYVHNNIVKW